MSESDTVSDPIFSIFNVLNCRTNSILSFNTGLTAPDGIVISMDIQPLSGGPSTQTLFSIRGSNSNIVALVVELTDADGSISVYRRDSGSGSLVLVGTSTTNLQKSNLLFEKYVLIQRI